MCVCVCVCVCVYIYIYRERERERERSSKRALTSSSGCWYLIYPATRFWGAFAKCRKPALGFVVSTCLSVCPHGQLGTYWTDFQWKLDIRGFIENLSGNIQLDSNLIRITDTLHENLCTRTIISQTFVLRLRNVSDTFCRENQSIHFVFTKFVLRKPCRLWDSVKYGRASQATDDNTVRRMRFDCRTNKARIPTHTHTHT